MGLQQTIIAILERGRGMLRKHLNDFSDADMLARTSPTANHAAYQLCHLLRTTKPTVAAFPGAPSVQMPAKVEGDQKAPPTSDDPNAFPSKTHLLDAFEGLVDALITAVRGASESDLNQTSPEQFKGFAATLNELALMVPLHMSMHVGQIQTIRRKLGKPVLF